MTNTFTKAHLIEIESRVLFATDKGVGELEGCWLKGTNVQF